MRKGGGGHWEGRMHLLGWLEWNQLDSQSCAHVGHCLLILSLSQNHLKHPLWSQVGLENVPRPKMAQKVRSPREQSFNLLLLNFRRYHSGNFSPSPRITPYNGLWTSGGLNTVLTYHFLLHGLQGGSDDIRATIWHVTAQAFLNVSMQFLK